MYSESQATHTHTEAKGVREIDKGQALVND